MIATTTTNSVHSVLPNVKSMDNNTFTCNDKVIQQLLNKLDKGTETIMNLRSLLTYKTAELNELVRQLELIDQVLVNVEDGTEQIELVLKDVINVGQDKLLHAEATLDSAIQSACSLYSIDSNYQQQRMMIVNKINNLLNELDINATSFWNKLSVDDDLEVLQHILVNLDLAKTIATNIKNDAKLRSTMLKNNKNASSIDQIKKMGDKLRSQIELYKSYTRNNTLCLNGKEDLLSILDREDRIISKKFAMQHSTKQQHIATTTTTTNVSIATQLKKKRQSTVTMTNLNTDKPLPPTPPSHTNNINKQTMSLLLLSRHTSSSKAKSKEPKRLQEPQQQQQRGPGSTLRLRNMLAKRNPALKILNEQKSSTTVC